jgi:hypothetical protein
MALTSEQKKADKNDDGLLSDKEVKQYNKKNPESPLQDTFTIEDARAEYGYSVAIIDSDPKLQELFTTAVAEGWSSDRFELAVKEWARDAGYGTGSALAAYKMEKEGGEVWSRALEEGVAQIKTKAVALGIDVGDLDLSSEAGQQMARDWVYGGYNTRSNEAVIDFLSPGGVGAVSGTTAEAKDSLRGLAMANGVSLSDSWYDQVVNSIARGDTDVSYWEKDIRDQSAMRFPLYAEKIRAGVNAQELAAPYISSMNRVLERSNVDLDDPWLSKAMNHMDEKGNPTAMPVYDFETLLRQSAEWQNTKNGKNTMLNTGTKFLKDLGYLTNDAGMVV